jgi:hypothetical protein
MLKQLNFVPLVISVLLLSSCSPRDFLTRRLAADLISGSATFRAQQYLQFRTGIVANQDYLSPNYLLLQHKGWISATIIRCPAALVSPPCWDVTLTPSGVDTVQSLIAPGDAEKPTLSIPVARRELVAITGIAKEGNTADVEFTWRWSPLNEVGAVLYRSDARYRSTVTFRNYDDGWRLLESTPHSNQSIDDALKNSEPAN